MDSTQYEHITSQLADLHTKFAVLESRLNPLFDNGQPGTISKMGQRISRLELYLAMAIGGGTVLNGGLGVLLWYISYAQH